MTKMTLERFEAATLAWGADLTRWPESLRQEAETLCADQPAAAEALLAAARSLDQALDAVIVEAPSAALRDRVLSLAPKARPRARDGARDGVRDGAGLARLLAWTGLRGGAAGFAMGAALAASCAAGVLAGIIANAEGLANTPSARAQDPGVEAVQLLHGAPDQSEGSWNA
ncbi:MAG: hypothetical protein KGL69_12230 [Alphaproteobacteria bacterium]|nr:hypothetical protein [Alphaproteobacteria bacterium]